MLTREKKKSTTKGDVFNTSLSLSKGSIISYREGCSTTDDTPIFISFRVKSPACLPARPRKTVISARPRHVAPWHLGAQEDPACSHSFILHLSLSPGVSPCLRVRVHVRLESSSLPRGGGGGGLLFPPCFGCCPSPSMLHGRPGTPHTTHCQSPTIKVTRSQRSTRATDGNPFYLCRVFALLDPSNPNTHHSDRQVQGMARRYIRQQ